MHILIYTNVYVKKNDKEYAQFYTLSMWAYFKYEENQYIISLFS